MLVVASTDPADVGGTYFMQCVATGGDSPIKLSWLKDGRTIEPTKVTRLNQWQRLSSDQRNQKSFRGRRSSQSYQLFSDQTTTIPILSQKTLTVLNVVYKNDEDLNSVRTPNLSLDPSSEDWYSNLKFEDDFHKPMVTINRLGDRSSELLFTNISLNDSGNYSCFAENPAGSSMTSEGMSVRGM